MSFLDEEEERKIFTEAFVRFDQNGDGEMDLSEFGKACCNLGFTFEDQTLKTMFDAMDTDKNGTVTLEEFLDFMGPDQEEKTEATVRRLFNEYDIDKDGLLTATEIQQAWFSGERGTKCLTTEEVQELITQVDENGDGKLNCEEFVGLVMSALKEEALVASLSDDCQ